MDAVRSTGGLLSKNQVAAVAASSLQKAEAFRKKWKPSAKAYGRYEDLFQDSEIDVVYIGLMNHQHRDAVVAALQAGKHVLCEKPLGLNVREVREMVQAARNANRFLMEGFWSRFFPVYSRLKDEIQNGNIGEPKMILATLGFNMHCSIRAIQKTISTIPRRAVWATALPTKWSTITKNNEHQLKREVGGGCLMMLGCYLCMFSLYVFQEKPIKIIANGFLTAHGTDDTSCITLLFSEDRMAQLNISASYQLPCDAQVFGSKGRLKIPDQVYRPHQLETPEGLIEIPLPNGCEQMKNQAGFAYEAEAVRQCIIKGLVECPIMPLEESITISEILDECREQLGVSFF